MRLSRPKILLIVLLLVLVLGAAGFAFYVSDYARPLPEALNALQSDSQVQFSNQNGWLVFQPAVQSNPLALQTGLIFYPGGKVDYRAYAPAARAIAAEGFLVVIPPMPFNLAFFDMNAAQSIINAYPQIKYWALAGHSLGGVFASSFAMAHPDRVQGVVFWASYPAGDMKNYPGQVVSISATQDGLATPAKIAESKANLPPSTQYIVIQGGDHAQFGAYGPQQGDNPAAISQEEQQAQIVHSTVKLLQSLGSQAQMSLYSPIRKFLAKAI